MLRCIAFAMPRSTSGLGIFVFFRKSGDAVPVQLPEEIKHRCHGNCSWIESRKKFPDIAIDGHNEAPSPVTHEQGNQHREKHELIQQRDHGPEKIRSLLEHDNKNAKAA
jgi:hypothetical protein